MGKFLTASFILLASCAAVAVPSYWAGIETTGYEEAEGSGVDDVAGYAGYYCTVKMAEELFDGTSVGAIETYLGTGDNFWTAKAKATYDSVAYGDGEYHILDYTQEAFTSSKYVAIAFYGNKAYRVYGLNSAVLTPNGQLVFNEAHAASGSVGNWQQAVPEPTSGTLLLLGAALVALRRKQRSGTVEELKS